MYLHCVRVNRSRGTPPYARSLHEFLGERHSSAVTNYLDPLAHEEVLFATQILEGLAQLRLPRYNPRLAESTL